MKMRRGVGVAMLAALMLSLIPMGASVAAPGTELVVHFHKPGGLYSTNIEASALSGETGVLTASERDEFGLAMTFSFGSLPADSYLSFTIGQDSVFPDDKRYVRATGSKAEVWALDGEARVFDAPALVNPATIVKRDKKAYVAVEDLTSLLGLTFVYGKNGYRFDGAATGTVDILTIYRHRDYFEIDVNRNRIGSNVTGNMLNYYNDLVFDGIDGFRQGGKYYLSFGAIEKLFQVRTLVDNGKEFILDRQFAAHNALATADPADVGFDPKKLDAIDDYINAQVNDGASAVALVVTKNGKVVKENAYGYSKKYSTSVVDGVVQPAVLLPEDQWEPATVGTLFDLASNSKMYATNYAIQKLVTEGKLDLDRRLSSYPGWENFTDANSVYTGKFVVGGAGGITAVRVGKETVTIRDILHHNAGLIPDPEYPNRTSSGDLYYQTTDYRDRAGIIDVISKTPLMYTPRTTFAYSDVDYMILGLLVEQISGLPLDEYLAAEFYTPLGLDSTTFRPLDHGFAPNQIAATELNGNTRDGNISFGTLPDSTPVPIRNYTLQGEVHDEKAFYSMAGVAGHAGLFSTTSDMAVLTQLMLGGGIYGDSQYFSREVVDQFTVPFAVGSTNVNNSTIGLGWRVHSKAAAAYYYFNWGPSRSTFGHQGWTGTLTIIDPLNDMTITILTSMRHSPVVSPPNGFAGANYDVADMVPISAQVYRALDGESEQYNPLTDVAAIDDVSVTLGAKPADVAAVLPTLVDVTDSAGAVHQVHIGWDLSGFDGSTLGTVAVTGRFDLPAGVTQAEPAVPLTVSANVQVVRAAGSVTLGASTVKQGAELTFRATGFSPGEKVDVTLVHNAAGAGRVAADAAPLATFTADALGAVSGTVTIPSSTQPGVYGLRLLGADSAVSLDSADFTVSAVSGSTVEAGTIATAGVDALVWIGAGLILLLLGAAFLLLRRRAKRTS